jgi:hypothetical protein
MINPLAAIIGLWIGQLLAMYVFGTYDVPLVETATLFMVWHGWFSTKAVAK